MNFKKYISATQNIDFFFLVNYKINLAVWSLLKIIQTKENHSCEQKWKVITVILDESQVASQVRKVGNHCVLNPFSDKLKCTVMTL